MPSDRSSRMPPAPVSAPPPVSLDALPTPLAQVLEALDRETQPFRAVHRLIDTVEVLVKLHTVVILSAFAESLAAHSPADGQQLRRELAETLQRPSLGHWWGYAVQAARALDKGAAPEPAPGFRTALMGNSPLRVAVGGERNLITFRNGYAHGATPDDEACRRDLTERKPTLEALIAAQHLANLPLVVVDDAGRAWRLAGLTPQPCDPPADAPPGHIVLLRTGAPPLDLHPLLLFRQTAQGEGTFFFNDLREKDGGALHYTWSQRIREAAIRTALLARFPLDAWKSTLLEPDEERAVRERIASLTESFKGRREELGRLIDHLGRRASGIVMLWGAPGVGKSALLARALQWLEWGAEARRQAYPDLEAPRLPPGVAPPLAPEEADGEGLLKLHLARIFVRRGAYPDVRSLFEALSKQLDRRFQLTARPANSAADAAFLLRERLAEVAKRLRDHERLVVVVDGIDEAAEHGEFLRGLPKEVPDRVHLVYASRDQTVVRSEVYDALDPVLRREETLLGLRRDDTRALLYEHVDKYTLRDDWVEAIVARSEGNALYLRLFCDALERGELVSNDIIAVPMSMTALYAGILRRVSATPGAASLLALLATARAFLPEELIGELLSLETPGFHLESTRRAVAACSEVLMDDPATPERDWQLFHESLREYFLAERGAEVDAWHERLARWGEDWRSLEERPAARSYALRWGATHLEARRLWARRTRVDTIHTACQDKILALVDDADWRNASVRVCGNAESMRRGIHFAQQVAVERFREIPVGDHQARAVWRDRVARYAEMTWGEERRIHEAQRQALRRVHRDARWADVSELARIGTTARARALLAILSLWGDRGTRRTEPAFTPEALEEIGEWFSEADETALYRLWELFGGPSLTPASTSARTPRETDSRLTSLPRL